MRIPDDNPLFSSLRRGQDIEKEPLAWFYPNTPIIVGNFADEEFNPEQKNSDEINAVRHEIFHVWQIKSILPLTTILFNNVCSALLVWEFPSCELSSHMKKASDTFSKWRAFLEGQNVLHSLWDKRIPEESRRCILNSLFEQGNEVHAHGVKMIIGENSLSEEIILDFVSKTNVVNLVLRLNQIVDMAPFIKNPNLNLVKIFNEWGVAKIADLAAEVLFNEPRLLRLEEQARRIKNLGKNSWSKLLDWLGHISQSKTMNELLFRIPRQLLTQPFLVIPVITRNGFGSIPAIPGSVSKELSDQVCHEDAIMWLLYASLLEGKTAKDSLVCPFFRITEGAKLPFCHRNPTMDWCSLVGSEKTKKVIDITVRTDECRVFWKVIKYMLLDYFNEGMRNKKMTLGVNRITFRREMCRLIFGDQVRLGRLPAFGGWITFDWLPDPKLHTEDVEGISREEAFEAIEKLPLNFYSKYKLFRLWLLFKDNFLIVEIEDEGNTLLVLNERQYFLLTLLRLGEANGLPSKKAYSHAKHVISKYLPRRFLSRREKKDTYKTWQDTSGKKMRHICTKEELYLFLKQTSEVKDKNIERMD